MSKVCVVTGGGSGMGLAAAKLMPKDHIIVVSGRTESKPTKAVEELTAAGFAAYAKSCDTSKRVASLSPGLIATDMGNLEAANGGPMLAFSCENRMGTPEELGFAIATLADERNGYLAGVDILCDGGTIRGMHEFKKPQ